MPTAANKRQSKPAIIVVRLKRYNPKRGQRLQRFALWGYIFKEEQNWYKVPAKITYMGEVKDLKDYLENVHQDNEDPDSPFAFDVVTEKEAEAINKRERQVEQMKQYNLRRTGEPVDMTGARRRSSREPGEERGDLTLDDVKYKAAGRRKYPRSMKREVESTAATEE